MIEAYVILTLGAIGYLLNKSNQKIESPKKNGFIPSDSPSMTNIYNSSYADESLRIAGGKASKMHEASKDPKRSGVISQNYHFTKADEAQKQEERVMSLTGQYMTNNDFTHNNMVPFFGGSVRQNVEPFATRSVLENFNGVVGDDMYAQKKEVKSFYDKCQNMGNVNGMANQDAFFRERMNKPLIQNNTFPIPKVYVGPGLNKGYTAAPTGGYQQMDSREFIMPKCVDELRAANKPKVTYDGVQINGMKAKLSAKPSILKKNRPERYYEKTPDMWFKTTGAVTGKKINPEFIDKDTNRRTTTTDYFGTALGKKERTQEPFVNDTIRQQFDSFGVRNAAADNYGKGDKADYGKASIMVYGNERDITSTRVHQGNFASIIKALTAPFTDMVKVSKKEEAIDNPRHFGNMSIQIPDKPTIYDPNDIARTTIKETLIHDGVIGNLAGPKQLTVYDPDDIARVTIRQTLEDPDYLHNLKGRNANMQYNEDPAKTTIKETTIDMDRYGNIDKLDGGGGYETTEWDARNTQKQFLSDNDYYGQVGRDAGGGYATNEYDARNTQKQFISDNDYFGAAVAAGMDKKSMSNEYMMNADINANKETTLFGREPTQTGKKETSGKESYNIVNKKVDLEVRDNNGFDKIYNEIPASSDVEITKMKKDYGEDERLDISLLKSFLDNPLAINVAAGL